MDRSSRELPDEMGLEWTQLAISLIPAGVYAIAQIVISAKQRQQSQILRLDEVAAVSDLAQLGYEGVGADEEWALA